jgi:hypothetical protein
MLIVGVGFFRNLAPSLLSGGFVLNPELSVAIVDTADKYGNNGGKTVHYKRMLICHCIYDDLKC